MHGDWIKGWRMNLDHPLYKRPLIWHYWDYCLIEARHEPKTIDSGGKPLIIEIGCFVTGIRQASTDTGLTEQNIRTAQKVLINHKMIEKVISKSTNKLTYIRVCNYDIYQPTENESQQTTNELP